MLTAAAHSASYYEMARGEVACAGGGSAGSPKVSAVAHVQSAAFAHRTGCRMPPSPSETPPQC